MTEESPPKKSVYKSEENRQQRLKAQKTYYQKNRERILAQRKKLRHKTPESVEHDKNVLVELYENLERYLKAKKLLDTSLDSE
jgi:hypothetical protein